MEYDLAKIANILKTSKVIAIVGLSPKPERPSNQVAKYLIKNGYEIIPVNPGHNEILDKTCYPSLSEIPTPVDIVDIFRRPEDVLPIMKETIQIKATFVWMQEGVRNEEAVKLGENHGLAVIQDLCIKKMHQKCKVEGLI